MNPRLLSKIIVDSLGDAHDQGEEMLTGVELVMEVTMRACKPSKDAADDLFETDEYFAVLSSLVKEGIVCETPYTTKGMEYRQKHYYSLNPQRVPA
jgi:hypothetical protein